MTIRDHTHRLNSPDSVSIPIELSLNQQGTSVWIRNGDPLFRTFIDAEGDLGSIVDSGLHCLKWNMGVDMPNVEGIFNMRILARAESCYGVPLRDNGTICNFSIVGPFGGEALPLNPLEESYPGDYFDGMIWFTDTTWINYSGDLCDSYPAYIRLGYWYGGRFRCYFYVHYYLCSPVDTIVYLDIFADDDLVVYKDGEVILSDRSHGCLHCIFFEDIEVELSARTPHSMYFWVYNDRTHCLLSHKYTDAYDNPITNINHFIDPPPYESPSFIYTAPLDTERPRIELLCPDGGIFGSEIRFNWTIEEMFLCMDTVNIIIDDGEHLYYDAVAEDEYFWTVPDDIDNIIFSINVRDSFCNVSSKICSVSCCCEPCCRLFCPNYHSSASYTFSSCSYQPTYFVIDYSDCIFSLANLSIELTRYPRTGAPVCNFYDILSPEVAIYPYADSAVIEFSDFSFEDGDNITVTLRSITNIYGCRITP